MVGFSSIFPVGARRQSEAADPGGGSGPISFVFPPQFSPLAGSIDIVESQPFLRVQFGEGYQFRQAEFGSPSEVVSMSFIGSDRKGLQTLLDFLTDVGGSESFAMSVPGARNLRWYRNDYRKKHIQSDYWQVDLKIESANLP